MTLKGMSVRKVYHLYCFDPDNLEDCKRAVRNKALSPDASRYPSPVSFATLVT